MDISASVTPQLGRVGWIHLSRKGAAGRSSSQSTSRLVMRRKFTDQSVRAILTVQAYSSWKPCW